MKVKNKDKKILLIITLIFVTSLTITVISCSKKESNDQTFSSDTSQFRKNRDSLKSSVESSKKQNNQIEKSSNEEYFIEDFTIDYKEIVQLLSIKHNINESITDSIIDEYLSSNNSIEKIIKDALLNSNSKDLKDNLSDAKVSTKESIINISTKFKISKDRVSNLIFDYYMLSILKKQKNE